MNTPSVWFLNTRVTICLSRSDNGDGVSVLEHRVPCGDSPPLHIHRTEDEVFRVLEGEFRVHLDGKDLRVGPGDTFVAPRGIAHSYRAESPEGGRFLTVTVHGDFERFVRSLGRAAQHDGLPERSGPPTPEAIAALTAAAAEYGIDIIGPPLQG